MLNYFKNKKFYLLENMVITEIQHITKKDREKKLTYKILVHIFAKLASEITLRLIDESAFFYYF